MRRFLTALLATLLALCARGGPSVDELVAKLGAEEWKVREEATHALMDMGEEAAPALREALKSEDPEVQMRAREALQAIEIGFGSKAYKEFGSLARTWGDLTAEQKLGLLQRMEQTLGRAECARPFARLARLEPDGDRRGQLIGRALECGAEAALAELERQIAEKPDPLVLVRIASHYRNTGQADKAEATLARMEGPVELPPAVAREVALIHSGARRWKKAADAFGALADRAPAPEEAQMAGERIAWLHLAGEAKEAAAGVELALKAEGATRDVAVLAAVDILTRESRVDTAIEIAEAASRAGVAGTLNSVLGRLLLSQGREAEAILAFRRALKTAPDEGVLTMVLEDLRNAYEAAGEPALASASFLEELKDPVPAAGRHMSGARLLEKAGQPGLAAVEWRKAATLLPGSPFPAAAAARTMAAAGDPRAARWAAASRAWGGMGWAEESLLVASAPAGRRVRPVVRRAVEMEREGTAYLYAVCGDVGAVADALHRTVVGFRPDGTTAWTWKWSEPARSFPGAAQRTRTWDMHGLVPLADGFLVAIAEHDTVASGMSSEERYAGEWLVTLDAATGEPRSKARSPGLSVSHMRPSVARGDRVATIDPGLSVITALDFRTGTTAWVAPVDRYASATEPQEVECLQRLAAWGDLVLAPSPHGSRVRAFRFADGSSAWDAPLPGPVVDVRVAGDRAYVAAGRHAACLDAATGRALWTVETGGAVLGAPAPCGGVVAARSADGWLRGLDGATGRELWRVFVGPPGGLEWIEPAGGVFFLLRRDGPTWAVAADGRPLRRLHLDFNAPPVAWKDTLLADDTFGRRRPLHAPPGLSLTQEYTNGLLRIDPAPLLDGDAAAIAKLLAGSEEASARVVAEAALQAIDPEDPDLLFARATLGPPPGEELLQVRLDDAWRALDACPPLDPRWDAIAAKIGEMQGGPVALDVEVGQDGAPWAAEQRVFAALARLRRDPGDAAAPLALGRSGVAGLVSFLGEAPDRPARNAACAIARVRLGDVSAIAAVVDELANNRLALAGEAAEALRFRREPEAIDALRQCLGENRPVRVRLAAALALAREKDAVALNLLEVYGVVSEDRAVFLESARLLLAGGRARGVDALARADEPALGAGGLPGPFELLARADLPAAADRLEAIATDGKHPWAFEAAFALGSRHRARAHAALASALQKGAYDSGLERRILELLSPGEFPDCAAVVAARAPAHLESPTDVNEPQFRLLLADAFDTTGRGVEARVQIDFYASLCPDTPSYCNNAAWFMAISRTPELNDGPAALALALRAVEAVPESASYWDTLSEALRECGLRDAAALASMRAWQLAPKDGDTCDLPYCARQLARMLRIRDTARAAGLPAAK